MKKITLLLIAFGFAITSFSQTNPVISCPADVVATSDPGDCGAIVNFADATALDAEDGALSTTQTAGPVSGTLFSVGTTIVTFEATDSDNNTVICSFNVTVNDTEAPVAACQDITIELDATGNASITTADIDNGSFDNCAGFVLSLDTMAFDCSNVGANTVNLTVTDTAGLTDSCTATVTVEDNQAPIVYCKGGAGVLTVSENFDAGVMPAGWTTEHTNAAVDLIPAACDTSGVVFSFECTHNPFFTDGDNPNFSGNCATINDDKAGSAITGIGSIVSPTYDISNGGSLLSFDYENADMAGTGDFIVEVFDGSAWVEVYRQEEDANGHEDIDITSYNNADFQVKFSYDDEGGWSWGASFDNFVLTYLTAETAPLEVDLMADGTVTINADDLVDSVDDNCNYTVGAGGNTVGSLETTFEAGNGHAGNMFDIVAVTPLTIDSFDVNMDDGTTDDVEVYFKTGTWMGSETNAGDWTLVATATGITSVGDNVPTPLNLNLGIEVPAGDRVAFYVTLVNTTNINYTNGGTTGDLYASDDNIEFYEGAGKAYPFGSTFSPRIFNGNIHYTAGPAATYDFDCSNLGENSVDVTVTDAGGNVATCTATVIVHDVTAPEVVCGPEPIFYGSGYDSDNPALAIAPGTTESTIITVADDFTIDDLNVYVNISYPSLNELNIDLTSPAGTTLNLFFPIGGCAGFPDLNFFFDDEGIDAGVLCTDLQTGGNFDIATILGLAPLSTFDGESLMGDWTLTVSAGASGTATINSWGLEHENHYANPTTDLIFELDANGEVHLTAEDMTSELSDACGIDVVLVDQTDFDCSDIGTPIMVTVFVNDASGNFASCQKEVNIVDAAAPSLTCPGDMVGLANAIPSDNAGVYTIPDYYATGQAFGDDNCTDTANIIFTQDPPAGTVYGINYGTAIPNYVITFTAEDENGNIATCSFEMQVKNGIGVTENTLLNQGLSIYPNPATDSVRLENLSDFAIETASVYDVNGKLVAEFDLDNKQINTLDVSNLTSGVFMVKVVGKDASAVKQLIVK
jgi:subtilisin-like proprotein convertase family protein